MTVRLRTAVRALLVDDEGHVLLARYEFPAGTVWALPGGGLDDGESTEAGLRRELDEELGLSSFDLGPHIWNREHIIPMSTGHDGQRDTIHLVRIGRFDPRPRIGWDALRAEHVHELRWWSPVELGSMPTALEIRHGETRFAPRRLAELVRLLLDDGPPSTPIDTGI